jgi:hypothetical protein
LKIKVKKKKKKNSAVLVAKLLLWPKMIELGQMERPYFLSIGVDRHCV